MSDIVELKLRADLDAANKQHIPVMVVQTTYLSDIIGHVNRLRAELAEARDKALDEAVEVADHHREKWGNAGGFESQAVGARIITQAIRALKSPKPPIL